MGPKSKLKAALDSHLGRDYSREHQKRLEKKARVQKAKRSGDAFPEEEEGHDAEERMDEDDREHDLENESGEEPPRLFDTSRIDDSDSESDDESIEGGVALHNGDQVHRQDEEEDDAEEEEDDIPLSDVQSLDSEDRNDLLPHQRLTINNTAALLKSLKRIALPTATLPFYEHQSITSSSPTTIADVNDDLNRELAFYKQNLDASNEARRLLLKEGQAFSRPKDYFAEMVKTDEHMGKVRQKLIDEAASKRASAEARRQRDLKKFGKQVQVAKLQERDKAKRETLDKIQLLKKKRKNAPLTGTHEGENGEAADSDLFDKITLEEGDGDGAGRKRKRIGGGEGKKTKRALKDSKYGFGGKKRFAKSGDAASSGDLSSFSGRRMKGKGSRVGSGAVGGRAGGKAAGGKKRLGKSRRKASSS